MDQWAACLRRSLAPTTSRLDPGTQSQNSPRKPESRTGHPSACSLQPPGLPVSNYKTHVARWRARVMSVYPPTTAEPNTELSIPGADAPLQKRSNPCQPLAAPVLSTWGKRAVTCWRLTRCALVTLVPRRLISTPVDNTTNGGVHQLLGREGQGWGG